MPTVKKRSSGGVGYGSGSNPHKRPTTTGHGKPAHGGGFVKKTKPAPKKVGPWAEIPPDKRKPGQLRGTQYVVIQAWTMELQVKLLLGAAGAQITAGYGNYTDITRPRNVSLLSWQGRAPYEMNVDVVFNGMPTAVGQGKSIEHDVRLLEDLATRQPTMISPPQVRLYGPVPHPELQWVITGITWGDAIRRKLDGARTMQNATIALHEWVGDPYLQPNREKGKANGAQFRWYVIKQGDTLKSIAKRLLGNPSKWDQIVKLNAGMHGYKLPQPKFKLGDRIKIPAAPKPAGSGHGQADVAAR